jgi:AcrR family transcriptional regulator
MPRQKQRTPELRDRLLHAAIDALDASGVAGLTTRHVAQRAATSVPAVYELFGDKAGLVREIFFEGFRRLGHRLEQVAGTPDARADLAEAIRVFRGFVRENPVLVEVMFSRPFADFDPGPAELAAGTTVRENITERVRRCVAEGKLDGDPTDLGHILIALAQGLARQEVAGWLGNTPDSVDRRWASAFDRILR